MPCCSAYNCQYRHWKSKTPGKSVHRFPMSRPAILKKWLLNMRRKNWFPSKWSLICSDHFKPECFDRTGQTVRLRENAVPTIFNFPPHMREVVEEGPSLVIDKTENNRATQTTDHPAKVSRNTIGISNDHSYNTSVESAHRMLKQELKNNAASKKKLKVKMGQIRRLKEKLILVKEVISDWKVGNIDSDDAMITLDRYISKTGTSTAKIGTDEHSLPQER